MHHSVEGDQLERMLGLARPLPATAGTAARVEEDCDARAVPTLRDRTGPGNAGRGLAIGLALSAILWMILLTGAYMLA